MATLKPAELHPRVDSLQASPPLDGEGAGPVHLLRRGAGAQYCERCDEPLDVVDVDAGICGACEYGLEP